MLKESAPVVCTGCAAVGRRVHRIAFFTFLAASPSSPLHLPRPLAFLAPSPSPPPRLPCRIAFLAPSPSLPLRLPCPAFSFLFLLSTVLSAALHIFAINPTHSQLYANIYNHFTEKSIGKSADIQKLMHNNRRHSDINFPGASTQTPQECLPPASQERDIRPTSLRSVPVCAMQVSGNVPSMIQ